MTLSQELFSYFQHVFDGTVPKDVLTLLDSSARKKDVKTGHKLIKRGQEGCKAYFLEKGEISIQIDSKEIHTLNKKSFIGLWSLVSTDSRHNADAICLKNSTVYEIDYELFTYIEKHYHESFLRIKDKIRENQANDINSANLSLKDQLEKTSLAMNFFSATIFLTLLFLIFIAISSKTNVINLNELHIRAVATNIMLLTYTLVYSTMIYRSSQKLIFYGLTLKNLKKDLFTSGMYSLCFLCIIIAANYCFIILTHSSQLNVFEIPAKKHTLQFIILFNLTYCCFTVLQEFCIRGVIQGTIMSLANTLYEKVRGILIVTMIFCCSHLHFANNYIFLIVIIPSLFWSFLYEKNQRRLPGVIFSHCLIGMFFFNFIGWHGAL